jgi:hypothetical protein
MQIQMSGIPNKNEESGAAKRLMDFFSKNEFQKHKFKILLKNYSS